MSIKKIGIWGIVIIVILVAISYDTDNSPDVNFDPMPKAAEDIINEGFTTNISVNARNNDVAPVYDVEAHMSVIEGENWEDSLEFESITIIAEKLDPGETGISAKRIQIKVLKVTGIDPKFKIQIELFANGTSTGNTWEKYFTLKE